MAFSSVCGRHGLGGHHTTPASPPARASRAVGAIRWKPPDGAVHSVRVGRPQCAPHLPVPLAERLPPGRPGLGQQLGGGAVQD